jgi:hypothetical protein
LRSPGRAGGLPFINYFDTAIGNVPFGSYKLADPEYDNKNFLIHDY